MSGEFSDVYPSNQSSLADILASSSCRILVSRMEGRNEIERWQQHTLGPFDGVISSILICQSCSSQISLEFQFFHSLPLSPVLSFGSTIMAGCTLEDCLKKFVIAEQIENYRCRHCWHIGAVKYLSLVGNDKGEIEKLKRCNEEDSCDCRDLPNLALLPWSNKYSNTIKQLSIARCPKILSINLKRVSINMFGEPIKLQGHIVFPLILDLSPYMTSWLDTNNREKEQTKQGQVKPQQQNTIPMLDVDGIGCHSAESFTGKPTNAQIGCSSETTNIDAPLQSNKVNLACELAPSGTQLYRLVSVVEHFGRAGSGHYTVYRSIRVDSDNEDSNKNSDPNSLQWVCVSDSQVYNVSVDDVLVADASLLFYERI